MAREQRCEKCGESFDSERGLSVHQAQMHGEDEKMEHESGEQNIKLGLRTAMFGVFALGIFVGLSTGLVFSELAGEDKAVVSGTDSQLPGNSKNTGKQDSGTEISGESTMAAITDIAGAVGLDGEKIRSCVKSAGTEEIKDDKAAIEKAVGNLGTPTFFIGNSEIGYQRVRGAQPYSRMKSVIGEKIQEARKGGNVSGSEYSLQNISFEGEPAMGEKSAPINIIEYSDYGCPWCAEWHGVDAIPPRPIDQENSFSKVRSNHVETGEVYFVYKDYPVPQLHRNAMTAHKAANCVLENSPEKYWKFSKKLYEERDKWKS